MVPSKSKVIGTVSTNNDLLNKQKKEFYLNESLNIFPQSNEYRVDPIKRQATRQSISSTGMKAMDISMANHGKASSKLQPALDTSASDFHDPF